MDGTTEFFGFCETSGRSMANDILSARCERAVRVGEQCTVLVGNQEARHDSIDTDTRTELLCHLGSHILGVTCDSRLSTAVSEDAGERTQCRLGTEIDNSPFFLLTKDRAEYLGGQDSAEKVLFDHLADSLVRSIEKRFVGCDIGCSHIASCRIQENVDSAKACQYIALVLL